MVATGPVIMETSVGGIQMRLSTMLPICNVMLVPGPGPSTRLIRFFAVAHDCEADHLRAATCSLQHRPSGRQERAMQMAPRC